MKAANTRVYATPLAQPYHTDSADAVGLLCLRPGLQGGLSSWASSVSVHNELLRRGRRVRPFVFFMIQGCLPAIVQADTKCDPFACKARETTALPCVHNAPEFLMFLVSLIWGAC